MRIKSILLLMVCFLLTGSAMPSIACPPPDCGECYTWIPIDPAPGGYCDWDCTTEQCCEDDDCVSTCPGCKSCDGEYCYDDDENCSTCKECDDGDCVLKSTSDCDVDSDCPGECHDCFQCECIDDNTKCDYFDGCEICNGGECEDKCPALGKHCLTELGICVECRDVLDCELCEECDDVMHKCEHPCDECVPPKYCGYACVCVECYYGEEDTTTCSTANNTTGCDCSENILNPCSSAEESVVYSGNSLKSCTGPNCGSVNVLCYTTYQTCISTGAYVGLEWCTADDVGPPPPAPWPESCKIILDFPGPGCYTCANSFNAPVQTDAPQGDCPIEDWPE